MGKSLKNLSLLLLCVLAISGLIYTKDLQQNNKETIFLTSQSQNSYQNYKEEFSEKSFIVFKLLSNEKPIINLENTSCKLLDYNSIPREFDTFFTLKGSGFLGGILICDDDFKAKRILQEMKSRFGNKISFSGVPYTNILLNKYSEDIKTYLFPGLFGGVLILLIFLSYSFINGFFLFAPCLMAASLSLVITKVFFSESNLITSIVPLLMFVINLALALHLFYTFQEYGNFKDTLREKKKPILLMILTTFAGFLSLYFSNLHAISIFGLMSACLMILSSFINILWFFLAEHLLIKKEKNRNRKNLYFQTFFSKKIIVISSFFFVILGSILFNRIPVLTDATDYFPASSGVKENIIEVTKSISGQPVLNIILNFKDDMNIERLKEIAIFEDSLMEKLSDHNLTLLSSNRFVKKINLADSKNGILPDFMISYGTLKSQLPIEINDGYPLDNKYRMTLLSSPMNVSDYEKIIETINTEASLRKYDLNFNGLYYHLMIAQKEMITTLFKSFSLSLLVISFIAYLAFRKIKIFFIFLVINIVPVFVSFLFLKIFGLSFNIATVMTYSISLGLIVDSTFHLIHVLEMPDLKYDYFYNTVVRPILGASLLLALCFSMFAFSGFLPIREFGICLAIIIIIGMIFDLKVLPTIYLGRNRL